MFQKIHGYLIEIEDLDGNIIIKNIVISNIDKIAPVIYGVINDFIYTNTVNITIRDELSGVSQILIEKDGKVIEYSIDEKIELSENGKYRITAKDNSGNETTIKFEISIIEESKDIVVDDKEEIVENNDPDDEKTLPKEEGAGEYIEENSVDMETESDNDKTKANTKLPYTGEKNIFIIIVVVVVVSTIMYIKLKKYKEVK